MKDLRTLKPTASSARLPEIDFLRGVALAGILIVNVWLFSSSFLNYTHWVNQWSDTISQLLIKLSTLLVEQRFVALFSLLFGLGISLQYDRFKGNPSGFARWYWKRTAVLAIFGIIHILFFFWGDILLIYSVLSVVIYFTLRLRERWLLMLAACVYIIPALLVLYPPFSRSLENYESGFGKLYSPQQLADIYRSGSLPAMIVVRAREWMFYNAANLLWQRTALAAMLTGCWIGRNQWHIRYRLHFKKIRRALLYMVPVVVAFTAFSIAGGQALLAGPVFFLAYTLFIPFTIGTYVLLLLWIYDLPYLTGICRAITHLGRMSLSNYFFQSLAGVMLFTGLGAGLYGQTSPLVNWALALGIYLVQLFVCGLYVKYYRIGPLEYLWRKASNS